MMYQTIRTAPKEVLLSIGFIEALALAIGELNLSRRKTPDWLADVLFNWINYGGIITDSEGNELDIDDEIIDRAHGNDGSFSSISALRRTAGQPRRRRPRKSMLLRLSLYDAAFKIIGKPIMIPANKK